MSVGSLYQYFPNKDAILVALMLRHVDDGAERMRSAVERWLSEAGSMDELVREVLTTMLDLHREQSALHQILMTRVPLLADIAVGIEQAEHDLVGELAAFMLAAGLADDSTSVVRATILASSTNALVHAHIARPVPAVPDETFITETTRMLVGYLATAS